MSKYARDNTSIPTNEHKVKCNYDFVLLFIDNIDGEKVL